MNDDENTGVAIAKYESTGVDSNDENTRVKSENYKESDMVLIDKDTTESELIIAEETELLARNANKETGKEIGEGEAEMEDAQDKQVIHPEAQVVTAENLYNIWRQENKRTDYTHRY